MCVARAPEVNGRRLEVGRRYEGGAAVELKNFETLHLRELGHRLLKKDKKHTRVTFSLSLFFFFQTATSHRSGKWRRSDEQRCARAHARALSWLNAVMTHLNNLTGVNGIFDDLRAFFLSLCVCVRVRVGASDCIDACVFARQLSPDPSSVLLSTPPPPPLKNC